MPFAITAEQKQTAFWIAVWLAFLLLLVSLGPILTPFLAAAILAYVLNPGVDRLQRLHYKRFYVPRPLAVLVVVVLFFLAITALVLIVVPVLQKEIPLLQAQIPQFLNKANDFLAPKLRDLGIRVRLDGTGIKRMLSQQMATSGDEIWSTVLASARIGGTAVLGWLATVVLIPVVLFYLLLDWHPMLARIAAAVPRRWVGRTVGMAQEVDTLLVGIITGLLVFIPYLGFGLGLMLALIAALLQFADWSGVIAVAVIYGCGQVIEGFFLTPRLVGERIGLNPLAVIFALLAFGQLFGFVGVLLALPASAVLMVAFKHLRRHYLSSSFYNA